jgi:hypothetical protein
MTPHSGLLKKGSRLKKKKKKEKKKRNIPEVKSVLKTVFFYAEYKGKSHKNIFKWLKM